MVDSTVTSEGNGRPLVEYARACKVTQLTVRRWAQRGLLEVRWVGGRLRVPETEFAKLERDGPPALPRIVARAHGTGRAVGQRRRNRR